MRRLSAFTLACSLLLGCDSEPSSSKSVSQTDQEKFEKDVLGVTNAYRDAFEAVAASLSKPAHPDSPCGDALPHKRPAEYWVGPTSIALTEDALQWFVSHPPTESSETEDVPAWAQGAVGYLNFAGFADHRVSSIDGARLRVLYDAVSLARYGEKDEHKFSIYKTVRRPGMIVLTLGHKFKGEASRSRPEYVLVLRDVTFARPKTPDEVPPSEDALKLAQIAKKHAPKPEFGAVDPEIEALLAGDESPTGSKGKFVGGALSGVLEVFDGATGEYVCGHRVSARNSTNFKSYYSGKQAVFDDLTENLMKDANKKFAHPVVRVYEPKE